MSRQPVRAQDRTVEPTLLEISISVDSTTDFSAADFASLEKTRVAADAIPPGGRRISIQHSADADDFGIFLQEILNMDSEKSLKVYHKGSVITAAERKEVTHAIIAADSKGEMVPFNRNDGVDMHLLYVPAGFKAQALDSDGLLRTFDAGYHYDVTARYHLDTLRFYAEDTQPVYEGELATMIELSSANVASTSVAPATDADQDALRVVMVPAGKVAFVIDADQNARPLIGGEFGAFFVIEAGDRLVTRANGTEVVTLDHARMSAGTEFYIQSRASAAAADIAPFVFDARFLTNSHMVVQSGDDTTKNFERTLKVLESEDPALLCSYPLAEADIAALTGKEGVELLETDAVLHDMPEGDRILQAAPIPGKKGAMRSISVTFGGTNGEVADGNAVIVPENSLAADPIFDLNFTLTATCVLTDAMLNGGLKGIVDLNDMRTTCENIDETLRSEFEGVATAQVKEIVTAYFNRAYARAYQALGHRAQAQPYVAKEYSGAELTDKVMCLSTADRDKLIARIDTAMQTPATQYAMAAKVMEGQEELKPFSSFYQIAADLHRAIDDIDDQEVGILASNASDQASRLDRARSAAKTKATEILQQVAAASAAPANPDDSDLAAVQTHAEVILGLSHNLLSYLDTNVNDVDDVDDVDAFRQIVEFISNTLNQYTPIQDAPQFNVVGVTAPIMIKADDREAIEANAAEIAGLHRATGSYSAEAAAASAAAAAESATAAADSLADLRRELGVERTARIAAEERFVALEAKLGNPADRQAGLEDARDADADADVGVVVGTTIHEVAGTDVDESPSVMFMLGLMQKTMAEQAEIIASLTQEVSKLRVNSGMPSHLSVTGEAAVNSPQKVRERFFVDRGAPFPMPAGIVTRGQVGGLFKPADDGDDAADAGNRPRSGSASA